MWAPPLGGSGVYDGTLVQLRGPYWAPLHSQGGGHQVLVPFFATQGSMFEFLILSVIPNSNFEIDFYFIITFYFIIYYFIFNLF